VSAESRQVELILHVYQYLLRDFKKVPLEILLPLYIKVLTKAKRLL